MDRHGAAVTLSRPGRARFDVMRETALPALRPVVLAHEIRKDLWRALRDLRGFSPVVRVDPTGAGVRVRAGGEITGGGHWPRAATEAAIDAVLGDPHKRARWIAHAGKT